MNHAVISGTKERTLSQPKSKFNQTLRTIKKQKYLFLLMLPGLAYFFIFKYGPMYGILLAFKDFNPIEGITGSPWVGFKHFEPIFEQANLKQVIFNTLRLSALKIVIGFPFPIIFALMLNEVMSNGLKRIVQTISYLPHFLSWVVVSGIVFQVFSPSYGLYGFIYHLFGWKTQVLLTQPGPFIAILVGSDIWKEIGFSSVIFLAALVGINAELYEVAKIDGAGRWKQLLYITLPSLLPIISIMFILRLGHVLDAGFDQVLNLYNPLVFGVADIVDTYVYRIGLEGFQFSFATAVGLCKGIVALILIVSTNWIVRKTTNNSIW